MMMAVRLYEMVFLNRVNTTFVSVYHRIAEAEYLAPRTIDWEIPRVALVPDKEKILQFKTCVDLEVPYNMEDISRAAPIS